MPNNQTGLLIEYISAIRNLANEKSKLGGIKLINGETFLQGIKRQFKFNKLEDWSFLCASMDLVEDTALAIQNFQEFKVEGPTKYDNDGEKYIRLYGLLNSVYLQQSAVLKIHYIFRVNNITQLEKQIKQLEIIDLRHKLGAHSIGYKNHDNEIDAIAISRITMNGFNLTFESYIDKKFKEVDLNILVGKYIDLMIITLDKIMEKAIETLYCTSKEKKAAWGKKLDLLRHKKAGDIVIGLKDHTIILKKVTGSDTDL